MSGMVGWGLGPLSGSGEFSSMVNTDWNWSLRILSLSKLVS